MKIWQMLFWGQLVWEHPWMQILMYICPHSSLPSLHMQTYINWSIGNSFCKFTSFFLYITVFNFFHFTKVSNFIFLHFPKDTVESMVRSAQDKCPNVLSEEKVVDDVRAACLAKSQVWYQSLWRYLDEYTQFYNSY